MKLFFAFIFAASTFVMPIENTSTASDSALSFSDELASESMLPRTIRVCWEVFGGEILCLTVEESFMGREIGDNLKGTATFNSRNNSMTLKMPVESSGTMVVKETTTFKVKGKEKTIKKGTKIRVRKGVAKVSFEG